MSTDAATDVAMVPTEREWGELTTQLAQTIHTQRNMRVIMDSLVEDHNLLRSEISQLKIMLRTALSVLVLIGAALGWIIDVLQHIP